MTLISAAFTYSTGPKCERKDEHEREGMSVKFQLLDNRFVVGWVILTDLRRGQSERESYQGTGTQDVWSSPVEFSLETPEEKRDRDREKGLNARSKTFKSFIIRSWLNTCPMWDSPGSTALTWNCSCFFFFNLFLISSCCYMIFSLVWYNYACCAHTQDACWSMWSVVPPTVTCLSW